VAAFERDLSSYRFGWRQVAAVLAAGAAAMGALPVLGAAGSGRWDLPHTGLGEATSWMAARSPAGGFRVLWLADPRVLPGAGWRLGDGTAYALSEEGLPDALALWPAGEPGEAAAVGRFVRQAEARDTVELGTLLAPYAVRYVVVVDSIAPGIPGYQSPEAHPSPARLVDALAAQSDLRQVLGQGGLHVFADDAALPELSTHVAPVTTSAESPTVSGWVPVRGGRPSATALHVRVPGGAVVLGRAPASSWQLVPTSGPPLSSSPAFGYAARFDVPLPGGAVTVHQRGSWAHGVEIAAEVAAWLVVAAALLGRRRWLDWWYPRVGRRRRRGRHGVGAAHNGHGAP
jgi:hypothetical protein